MKQDDPSTDMYYIMQGDCTVNIVDEQRIEHVAIKLLVEGSHFGEIGMIFKSPRTATIISRNYNTMARLGYGAFRDLVSHYPEYKQHLLNHLYAYKGYRKKFLWKILR